MQQIRYCSLSEIFQRGLGNTINPAIYRETLVSSLRAWGHVYFGTRLDHIDRKNQTGDFTEKVSQRIPKYLKLEKSTGNQNIVLTDKYIYSPSRVSKNNQHTKKQGIYTTIGLVGFIQVTSAPWQSYTDCFAVAGPLLKRIQPRPWTKPTQD